MPIGDWSPPGVRRFANQKQITNRESAIDKASPIHDRHINNVWSAFNSLNSALRADT